VGAVRRILRSPTESGFADAYLRGDLDIDGSVATAIAAARRMDPRRLAAEDVRRLIRFGLELRRLPADAPPAHEITRGARLTGRAHSRARDLAAIRFHDDVGESFYRLWLDRLLTYSTACFDRDTDPAGDLDAAQEAKLDLVCRKLDLRPGQRLLDIGCGWGSLILHAAERYRVRAVGVTLSARQADDANRRAALLGLEDRVRAEVRDDRDLAPLGSFDAVASIGMFEHVGRANLRAYFEATREAVAPGGRFPNHGIATNERTLRRLPGRPESGFVERYVFPDSELVPVERAIAVARDETGFDVLDRGCCGRTARSPCAPGWTASSDRGTRQWRPRARRSPGRGACTCRPPGWGSSRAISTWPSCCWQVRWPMGGPGRDRCGPDVTRPD
jgi:cyclopropane-fatty-acyl-phospholipid synthase